MHLTTKLFCDKIMTFCTEILPDGFNGNQVRAQRVGPQAGFWPHPHMVPEGPGLLRKWKYSRNT